MKVGNWSGSTNRPVVALIVEWTTVCLLSSMIFVPRRCLQLLRGAGGRALTRVSWR